MVKRTRDSLAVRLGKNISRRRKQLELTQESLAERAKIGIATLARYEGGTTTPSLAVLEDLATVLRISMGELLGDEVQPSKLAPLEKIQDWLSPLTPDDAAWMLSVVEQLLKRCSPQLKRKPRKSKNTD